MNSVKNLETLLLVLVLLVSNAFAVTVRFSNLLDHFSSKSRGTCLSKTTISCGNVYKGDRDDDVACTAEYGGFKRDLTFYHEFTNELLKHSTQYMLLSAHFGTYQMNRGGFQRYFRDLSDKTWNEAIELVEYANKRGGHHHNESNTESSLIMEIPLEESYKLNELNALAFALDKHKRIADMTNTLHTVNDNSEMHSRDAEIAEFLERRFASKLSKTIREIAGHITNLAEMLRSHDSKLAVYLFDQHLQ